MAVTGTGLAAVLASGGEGEANCNSGEARAARVVAAGSEVVRAAGGT